MISHASNGTLIRELFTPEGCGTLISKDDSKKLRKGRISDAAEILNLIRPLEESGLLINRSKEFIESEINNFRVIDVEGEIVACAALHLETETTAEISCIATSDQYRNKGLGKKLLSSLESQAKKLGVTQMSSPSRQIFVLTTGAAHWFIENEFTETSLDSLPKSRQLIYDTARKSKIFIKNI
jgi:amino-acid N-acetyltransferase